MKNVRNIILDGFRNYETEMAEHITDKVNMHRFIHKHNAMILFCITTDKPIFTFKDIDKKINTVFKTHRNIYDEEL